MTSTASRPPCAPRRPTTRHLHGVEVVDPYAWLRERDDPEVLEYLRAENAWVDTVLSPGESLRDELYDEMVERILEDDESVPAAIDGWLYYRRLEKGKQYAIHCRRREPDGEEEILLDLDRLAEDHPHFDLGALAPSPDHRLLAYTVDVDGSERFTVRILDLASGELLPDRLPEAARSVVWGRDGRTLYYLTRDETLRPYRAHRHVLGTDAAEDELLFEEPDGRFFAGLYRTRSRAFVVLELGTHSTTELHVLDAHDPHSSFRLLFPRRDGVEADLDHHVDAEDHGRFLVRTNLGAPDFRLLEIADDADEAKGARGFGDPATWKERVAERPGVVLERIDAFRRHLVATRRLDGVRGLEVHDLETGEAHDIDFEESVYSAVPDENPDFESKIFRLAYTSLVTPRTIVDYDMDDRSREVRKRQDVPGYDPDSLVAERLHATATDGTAVPISLVRRRDVPLDGSAPLLLYGYGSYGNTVEPRFSVPRLSLLDRGFVYAIAHVRGGGELGRAWYEAAKLEHKPRTFDDFIAAAEHLVAAGYTSSRRLVIRGGSAGGLLVGGAVARRPELFHAAVAEVPFVDVLHTMLDPTVPLTVIEYGEWGNPLEDPAAFEHIRGYSPYENVGRRGFPHLLVTAGLHDPRVQYWEPAKWVARLREEKIDDNLLLLLTEMGSGHTGPSGRYDALRREALKLGFVLEALARERNDLAETTDAGLESPAPADGEEDEAL